jgi:hypothetical protein
MLQFPFPLFPNSLARFPRPFREPSSSSSNRFRFPILAISPKHLGISKGRFCKKNSLSPAIVQARGGSAKIFHTPITNFPRGGSAQLLSLIDHQLQSEGRFCQNFLPLTINFPGPGRLCQKNFFLSFLDTYSTYVQKRRNLNFY